MFELTRQEKQVILFLVATALAGIGIDFSVKRFSTAQSMAAFNENLGKIDLNSADKDLLLSVSGIGEKLCQRIISYRQEKGRFLEQAELKNIKGITASKYEKIKGSFIVR